MGNCRHHEDKGKPVVQSQSLEWVEDVAFAVHIIEHLKKLNRMLYSYNNAVTQYLDNTRAFKSKLDLWEIQLSNNSPVNFSCLKDLCNAGSSEDLGQYKERISSLLQQFEKIFQAFDDLETEFKIVHWTFSITPSDMITDMQLKIIDSRYDSNLKETLVIAGLEIYKYLFPSHLKFRDLAAKALLFFGTTYLCDKVLSVINISENRLRSRPTSKNLNHIKKLPASQQITFLHR